MRAPPPPGGRPTWPGPDDDGLFVLVVLVFGGGLLLWLAWDTWRAEIASAAIAVFRWEVSVLRHFTDRFDLANRQMAAADPAGVALRDLAAMAGHLGAAVAWPAAALLALLGAATAFGSPDRRYRRRLGLDGLLAEQARRFRAPAAFVGRRLRLAAPAPAVAPPRPADPALTPAEWVERFARRATAAPEGGTNAAPPDADAARAALVAGLGPRWGGPAAATPAARVLFAAFALHLTGRREDAADLLGAASEALAAPARGESDGAGPAVPLPVPAPLLREADAAIRDAAVRGGAEAAAARHAHEATALMSLLVEARRRSGVLPPAAFAWLRLVDRQLWHALASLGFEVEGGPTLHLHPNPRPEAAGARDHWEAERAAGFALPEPHVGRALAALLGADGRPDGS